MVHVGLRYVFQIPHVVLPLSTLQPVLILVVTWRQDLDFPTHTRSTWDLVHVVGLGPPDLSRDIAVSDT